jgi:predicted enzyme related to lactoylglutathione lyase
VTSQAVLYVRDLELLAVFYRECIGLAPAETGDGYRELRADGLVLWLVGGRQSPDADTDRDGSVRRRSDVPVKLAFEVGSIDRAAGSIEGFGGTVAQTSWNFAGYRRRDAVDPEGNVIQLLEPLVPLR